MAAATAPEKQRLRVDWSGLRLTTFDPAAVAAAVREVNATVAAATATGDPALNRHRAQRPLKGCTQLAVQDELCPTDVQVLYLGANELADVPDLSALLQLRRLYLNNNRLTLMPATVAHLLRLEVLDLRSNMLKSVAGLPSLPELQRLSLSSNQIADDGVSSQILPDLPALRFLGLYGNKLTAPQTLLDSVQKHCSGLQELVVAHNPWSTGHLTGWNSSQWAILPQLEWLDDTYLDRRPTAPTTTRPSPTSWKAKRARSSLDDASPVAV